MTSLENMEKYVSSIVSSSFVWYVAHTEQSISTYYAQWDTLFLHYFVITPKKFTMVSPIGHLDPNQLDNVKPLAVDSGVKREYLAEGVKRIPIEVNDPAYHQYKAANAEISCRD